MDEHHWWLSYFVKCLVTPDILQNKMRQNKTFLWCCHKFISQWESFLTVASLLHTWVKIDICAKFEEIPSRRSWEWDGRTDNLKTWYLRSQLLLARRHKKQNNLIMYMTKHHECSVTSVTGWHVEFLWGNPLFVRPVNRRSIHQNSHTEQKCGKSCKHDVHFLINYN